MHEIRAMGLLSACLDDKPEGEAKKPRYTHECDPYCNTVGGIKKINEPLVVDGLSMRASIEGPYEP